MSKRWYKKDISWLQQQLETFALQYGLYRPRGWILQAIEEKREEIVVANARAFQSLLLDRAKSDRETVDHALNNPNVWGNGTPDIISRFTKLAIANEKAADRIEKLLERIATEGLPEEVKNYNIS